MLYARHTSGFNVRGALTSVVSRKKVSTFPAGVTAARIVPDLSPTDAPTWGALFRVLVIEVYPGYASALETGGWAD
jgi:hypothetical protein